MTQRNRNTPAALEPLRLPELRARYQEVLGEPARSPNRTYLIRRILEAAASTPARRKSAEAAPPQSKAKAKPSTKARTSAPTAPAKPERGRYSDMTVEELQQKYAEVIGRATGSSERSYLIWKLREAEKGRIRTGPRPERPRKSDSDMQIVPLRLEATVVERVDRTWRDRSIPNRTEFLRRAMAHYLRHLGAADTAALLEASH
jgi:hypothetical protein